MIVRYRSCILLRLRRGIQVQDMQRGQRLVILRVRPLHVQLQRIGSSIVLTKQRLANLGNPLVGILVQLTIHGLPRPQRDIVQEDDIILHTTIHQRTELAIANGQRLLKVVCWTVVLQHHRLTHSLSPYRQQNTKQNISFHHDLAKLRIIERNTKKKRVFICRIAKNHYLCKRKKETSN